MPRITYIEPGGRAVTLELAPGQTLMRAAMDAELDGIEAQCGGNCSCATCHCYVQPQWLDKLKPPSEDERLCCRMSPRSAGPTAGCRASWSPRTRSTASRVQFPDRQS